MKWLPFVRFTLPIKCIWRNRDFNLPLNISCFIPMKPLATMGKATPLMNVTRRDCDSQRGLQKSSALDK